LSWNKQREERKEKEPVKGKDMLFCFVPLDLCFSLVGTIVFATNGVLEKPKDGTVFDLFCIVGKKKVHLIVTANIFWWEMTLQTPPAIRKLHKSGETEGREGELRQTRRVCVS